MMKVIIAGAGELGRLLASNLCAEGYSVTIIDSSAEELSGLTNHLDVVTIEGSAASVSVLKEAGIDRAHALLAVSGDEATNILACLLASKMGVEKTVCRLFSSDCFSDKDGVRASDFGIWKTFSTPEESVEKILDVMRRSVVIETIRFTNRQAWMSVLAVTKSSPLAGISIKDIPCSDRLRNVRFAALIRDKQFLVPHGETIIAPGDKLYVAGRRENVEAFVEWVSPDDEKLDRVVICGADYTARRLAKAACDMGCDVRIIEDDETEAEKLLEETDGVMLFNGDPTDEEMLEEAGVSGTDVFISAAGDDEDKILSCIMAKRLGARKVISLTSKPEYVKIVPALEMIDAAFSATLISVNAVLRLLEGGMMRIDTFLQRFAARLSEFKVSEKSPLCGKKIMECRLPHSIVIAMIFRNGDVITPSGDTIIMKDDTAVAIVTADSSKEIEPLFPVK